MRNYCTPVIGQWYRNPELIGIFEIVAIDDEEKLIEIQYFDGQIEEIDFSLWDEFPSIEVAAPEDWSGAYELPKEDILEYKEEVIHPEHWDNPANSIEPPDLDLED